jgi:hypothetical protein
MEEQEYENDMDIENLENEFSSISLQGDMPKISITLYIPTHGNLIINSGNFEPRDRSNREFKRDISIVKNNVVNIIRKNKPGWSCSSPNDRMYFKKMLPFVSFHDKEALNVFLDTLNKFDTKRKDFQLDYSKKTGSYDNIPFEQYEKNLNDASYVYIPNVENNQFGNKLFIIDQKNDPIEIVALYINNQKNMEDIPFLNQLNQDLNHSLTVSNRRQIDLNSLFILINDVIKRYVDRKNVILEINVVDLSCTELLKEGYDFAALPVSKFDTKSQQFPFVEQSKASDIAYFGNPDISRQDAQSDFTMEEIKNAAPGNPRIQPYTRRSREPRKSIFREQPVVRDRSRSRSRDRDQVEKGGRKLKKKSRRTKSRNKTKKRNRKHK